MSLKNKVLSNQFKTSKNLYKSDIILHHYLNKHLSKSAYKEIEKELITIGERAATEMDTISLAAEKNPPELVKRDKWGEDIDQIKFHPSYERLVEIAVESKMFSIKWQEDYRTTYAAERNKMSFGISSIYAMSEMGVYCPLCMTDGVAVLIDKFCDKADKDRLLSAISTNNIENFKSGAMYLTEKAGGSDVGANLVTATHYKDKLYHLNGEKWFCSNANGEIAFVLARTNPEVKGTKGLSIFLVEKKLKDGSPNPMNIIRLKDKLGVKSMASAEIILENTVGKLIGEEFQGFKIMTNMINLSRVYNSVAALSASRRAITEAHQFLNGRKTFGKNALHHPLIRKKLEELGSLHVANFSLVWRAIDALDKAENDENEAELLRVLTPMVKKWSAEKGVYMTRESMELMGGIGYIEDQIMPKLMRDIMVLPIWEGAGNIMILDMIRASFKTKGVQLIFKKIQKSSTDEKYGEFISEKLSHLTSDYERLANMDEEEMQSIATEFFGELTHLYQMSLMIDLLDETSKGWINPALNYFKNKMFSQPANEAKLRSVDEIHNLIAWNI